MDATNQARQILEAAQARIEKTGWTQGTYGTSEGPNCVSGALVYAAQCDLRLPDVSEGSPDYAAARHALHDVVLRVQTRGVSYWNDNDCESAEQAVEMLRLAAKELDE